MDGQSCRADRASEGKGDSQKRAMPRQRRLTEKELPCSSRWLGLMSSAAIKVARFRTRAAEPQSNATPVSRPGERDMFCSGREAARPGRRQARFVAKQDGE